MSANSESFWHIDKRIPISVIATILGQTAIFVWVLSDMRNDIDALQSTQLEIKTELAFRRPVITNNSQHMAVTDEAVKAIYKQLDRIEIFIEKLP